MLICPEAMFPGDAMLLHREVIVVQKLRGVYHPFSYTILVLRVLPPSLAKAHIVSSSGFGNAVIPLDEVGRLPPPFTMHTHVNPQVAITILATVLEYEVLHFRVHWRPRVDAGTRGGCFGSRILVVRSRRWV